jgi:hypothetical protein
MNKNTAVTNGDNEMEIDQEESPLQRTIRDLLGPNFNVGNYALVSMLTMVAVMFMFQTDIIAFQQALSGLNPDQISALTIALGGPIDIRGITNPEDYRRAVDTMYQNFAATMNIQQENIAGMVEEIVRRNTEMQELIPAGWTFPSIYGEERRFDSVVQLGNQLLSDATNPVIAPVSQLFSTILTSLRRQIGIPSIDEVTFSINDNIRELVQNNPRLEPARAYYHAVLGIFNGDGNLWDDLQNISTITAFNQYYHIYAGVFVAFFVALRNTLSITGYVARGIVNVGTDAVSFAIGPELYNDIVHQVGDITRNIARLPVRGAYFTARYVIYRINSVVNFVATTLTPRSQFDLFMGDPVQVIPYNLIVGGDSYELLSADSSVDYDTFTEIANFLQLYIIDNEDFQDIVEMMSDPNLAQHLGNALERVLVPEQNSTQGDSQGSEMTTDTTASSRASSISATYGSNPALMARFLRNILSVFFTSAAIAVIENPNVENPATLLIEDLTTDVSQGASQSTQYGLRLIETVIIPDVEDITDAVEEVIEHPRVFESNNETVIIPAVEEVIERPQVFENNMNVVSSAENSQNSDFSADEAANVLMDMPNDSNRLGGRKRKTRAKKHKGGRRRKTMKKSKKSKLRKHKTLKRRKSYKKRKTRKV